MGGNKQVLELLNSSPSVALLRARSSGIIIDFLTGVFGDVAAVSHENIHSLLAEYLNSHGVDEDEESEILYTDTYEEKTAQIEIIKRQSLWKISPDSSDITGES